jgi:predicted DNA binding CopG/RHH family protein
MRKKLPVLKTDRAAEAFVENADLTQYDLSDMRPLHYEFQPKAQRITMRLPVSLVEAVKKEAARAGIPYQRYIRQLLEAAVHHRR